MKKSGGRIASTEKECRFYINLCRAGTAKHGIMSESGVY